MPKKFTMEDIEVIQEMEENLKIKQNLYSLQGSNKNTIVSWKNFK
jgi:hypothetical protein